MVGKVPNHIEVIESAVGCWMRDPNLEFGVDPVKEEDWTCRLWDRHRGDRAALVDRRLRVLQ